MSIFVYNSHVEPEGATARTIRTIKYGEDRLHFSYSDVLYLIIELCRVCKDNPGYPAILVGTWLPISEEMADSALQLWHSILDVIIAGYTIKIENPCEMTEGERLAYEIADEYYSTYKEYLSQ